MSGVILPSMKQILALQPGRFTEPGRKHFAPVIDFEQVDWIKRVRARDGIGGGSGSFSNFTSPLVLNHVTGEDNASWANLSPTFFCLLTVVPDSSKTLGALPSPGTGGTVTEAAFTSYARFSIANTGWNAASAGGAGVASSITNNGTITMAGCTGSSSTVIAWCLGDKASIAGDVLAWGSATSVVISTTQTPPTVASGALQITLL
jgi:hypothetical protein